MGNPHPFLPVKLVAGLIYSWEDVRESAERALAAVYGEVDWRSDILDFDLTDYYAAEMGDAPLRRMFLSFRDLRSPEELPAIKLRTNALEEDLRGAAGLRHRPVNIDPGYLTRAALIMATTKDFSHRVPLRDGIYAHLEMLFGKGGVRTLDWTYPDLRRPDAQRFFLRAREIYLGQLA